MMSSKILPEIYIPSLSAFYSVRLLCLADVEAVFSLYEGNETYFVYSDAERTREQVVSDMRALPEGIERSKKFFVGFFDGKKLVAVMDLVDGYPTEEIAYVGLFMVDRAKQGRGIGSSIIEEVAAYLKETGKKSIRLCMAKDNPQATHFWAKNGFSTIKEVLRNHRSLLIAEKTLQEGEKEEK